MRKKRKKIGSQGEGGGKKRTAIEREKDLLEISEMYLHGLSQYKIAEKVGLSQAQIANDLRCIREQWKKNVVINFEQARLDQLQKLDLLESELWEQWEKSKSEEGSRAYCGYADRILDCIDKRCRILSCYSSDHKKHLAQAVQESLTDDQMIHYIEEKVYGLIPETSTIQQPQGKVKEVIDIKNDVVFLNESPDNQKESEK